MNIVRSVYITVFCLFTGFLAAQNVSINNIVATDIMASKSDVIEIEFVDQLPNLPFILAWIDESGEQFAIRLLTQEGKLIVPIHIQERWKGKIGLVGLSIPNVNVKIRKKNIGDQWREFLSPFTLSPGSINFTGTYGFFGQPFRWVCLLLMMTLAVVFFVKSRNLQLALLMGFIIAWSTYDLRSTKNRWDIISHLSANDYEIDIFKDLDTFLEKAREIIGDEAWSKEQLSGVLNSYCTYQLADLPYKPGKSGKLGEAAYVITLFPEKRNVVHQHGAYHLIKKSTE